MYNIFDFLFDVTAVTVVDCLGEGVDTTIEQKALIKLVKKHFPMARCHYTAGLTRTNEKGTVLIKPSGKLLFLSLSDLKKNYCLKRDEISRLQIYPRTEWIGEKQQSISIIDLVERLEKDKFAVIREYYFPVSPFNRQLSVVVNQLDL